MIEARWPDQLDTDVDLWVQVPGDVPVGYSNKGGADFNLLRDDLGELADATRMNYEVSYSRGMPAGEYTVNLHLYRNSSHAARVPVTVVASVKRSPHESESADPRVHGGADARGAGAHGLPLPARRFGRSCWPAAYRPCSARCGTGSRHERSHAAVRRSVLLAATLAMVSVWSPRRIEIKVVR